MTLVEVVAALQLMGVAIDYRALGMIIKYTAGVYVVGQVYRSSRVVKIYSAGLRVWD
jgi:hypothetical protein